MLLSRILRLRLDYSVSPILFVCSLQLSPELHVASFRTSSEAPQDWLVYNSALSLPPSSQILMGSAIEKNTSSIVNRSTNGDDKEDLSKRKTRKLRRLPPLHDVRNSSMKTVMRCASKRKDLIASFQDESSPVKVALCTIKAAACGVNLTAGSLADSVIRLGNGERAAAQEFFGRILPAIKDQRQECSDQRQGCSDQRQGCSGHRSKLH